MNKMKLLGGMGIRTGEDTKGYGKDSYVNVGGFSFKEKPVSEDMKEKFIGGRGFGLKLLWDAVKDTDKVERS